MTPASSTPARPVQVYQDITPPMLRVLHELVSHRRHCAAGGCPGCWVGVPEPAEAEVLPLFLRLGWVETHDADTSRQWRVTAAGLAEYDALAAHLSRHRSPN